MNYQANKQDLEPKIIVNDTPVLFQELVNRVKQRTHEDIPFMLMPVRLETRFMYDVEHNFLEELIEEPSALFLKKSNELNVYAKKIAIQNTFDSNSFLKASNEMKVQTLDLLSVKDTMFSLNFLEKNLMLHSINELESNIESAYSNLALKCTDADMQSTLNGNLKSENLNIIFNLKNDINNLPINSNRYDSDIEFYTNFTIDFYNEFNIDPLLGGNFNPDYIDMYLNSLNVLMNNVNSLDLDNNRKLFILEKIDTFNEHLSVFSSINYPDSSLKKEYQTKIFSTFSNFEKVWRLKLNSTSKSRPVLFEIEYSDLLNDEEIAILESENPFLTEFNQNVTEFLERNSIINESEDFEFDILVDSIIQSSISLTDLLEKTQLILADRGQILNDNKNLQKLCYKILKPINSLLAKVQNKVIYLSAEEESENVIKYKKLATDLSFAWANLNSINLFDEIKFSFIYKVDELWIRAYPDDIHINNHEKPLTQSEIQAGENYWHAWWAAHGDKNAELTAWKTLVDLFGAERAAWIAKYLTPDNITNAVFISSAYALNEQLSTLNTFTQQLIQSTNQPTFNSSIESYLTIYSNQLSNVSGKIRELDKSILSTQKELLRNNTKSIQTGFNSLSTSILQRNGEMGSKISAISASISNVDIQLKSINVISNWNEIYDQKPIFPEVEKKEANTSEASYTNVFPDRFLFAAINESSPSPTNIEGKIVNYAFNHIKIGRLIPSKLTTSVALTENNDFGIQRNDVTNELEFDESIKWMFDYQEAIDKGLACSIILNSDEAEKGFNKILALGVKLGENSTNIDTESKLRNESVLLIEELLNNHHYSHEGMEILKVGTPTNNTEDSDAGFNNPDPNCENSFATEVQTPLFSSTGNLLDKKDGQWITDSLGLNNSVFQHIKGANYAQVSNTISMNKALWNGTIGNFLEEHMGQLFSVDSIERTRKFFTENVSGIGMIPSIRVGNQPYGILASTSFTRWNRKSLFDTNQLGSFAFYEDIINNVIVNQYAFMDQLNLNSADLNNYLEDRYSFKFNVFLESLNKIWLQMADLHVKTVQNGTNQNPQQNFMEALGADGIISEVYNRFLMNSAKFGNSGQTNFTFEGVSSNILSNFKGLFDLNSNSSQNNLLNGIILDTDSSNFASTVDDLINQLTVFNTKPIEQDFILKGPSVVEKILSETELIGSPLVSNDNYIQWLLDATLNDIWKNNQFQNMQSRSLLFLLLRQSTLLTYRKTTWDLLVKEGVFSKDNKNIVGTVNGLVSHMTQASPKEFFTKWHPLFQPINILNTTPQIQDSFNLFKNPGATIPILDNVFLSTFLKTQQPTNPVLFNKINWESINDLKSAFNKLKNVSTAELDRLLKEHIGLCSYRLDAWNFGLVNKKLAENRSKSISKKGLYIGAYGWLMDVKPKSKPIKFPANDTTFIPADLQSPSGSIFFDQTNLGLIQTPSIAHGLTAAILKSGYLSETDTESNKFSINLKSDRVKKALFVLDGIRNGQTLSELLGYQFEKHLMENNATIQGMNECIQILRKRFPLTIVPEINNSTTNQTQPNYSRINNVVDGLELLESFRTEFQSLIDDNPKMNMIEIANVTISNYSTWINLGIPLNQFETTILKEIDEIANITDAIADIALTEGVFQIVKGNHARSSAIMESLTEGKNPPELEVLKTPRTGINIAHRLVAAIDPVVTNSGTSWKSILEPKLNQWIHELLIGFNSTYDNFSCNASYENASAPISVSLINLNIEPIELLQLVNENGFTSEMNNRVAYYVRQTNSLISDIEIKIDYNIGANNFNDLISLITSIKNIISNAKYLSPDDFIGVPNNINTGKFDILEISTRVRDYLDDIQSLRNDVELYIVDFTNLNPTYTISNANVLFNKASGLGVSSFFCKYSSVNVLDDIIKEDILNSLKSIQFELNKKINNLVKENLIHSTISVIATPISLPIQYVPASPLASSYLFPFILDNESQQVDKFQEIMNEMIGNGLKIIPKFYLSCYPDIETKISSQINNSNNVTTSLIRNIADVTNATKIDNVMNDWLFGLSRVEKNVDDLETVKLLSDSALLNGIRPVQFPENSNTQNADYWLGGEYPTAYLPEGDKLSVTIINSSKLIQNLPIVPNSPTKYAGLFLHNWDELIPNKEEITGVTFQYDQPSAKPPQNIILAVHPGNNLTNSTSWSIEDILYCLLDTIEMSKIRMVEPDHFKSISGSHETDKFELFKWILPMIVGEITPHNINNDTTPKMHSYQGVADSLQQVSFEFNPNNEDLPTTIFTTNATTNSTTSNSNTLANIAYQSSIISNTIQQLQNFI